MQTGALRLVRACQKHALGELGSEEARAVSLLQKLSITLPRENARAIMRRHASTLAVVGASHTSSLAATLAEEAASVGEELVVH